MNESLTATNSESGDEHGFFGARLQELNKHEMSAPFRIVTIRPDRCV